MITTATQQNILGDLANDLSVLEQLSEDYISDTRRLGFSVDEGEESATVRLSLDNPDGGDLIETRVNDHAQQQIGGRLGIPHKFWERMRDDHPDILQDAVTKLFVREPETRMIRTVGDTTRAFLSDRYRRLDNYDLMERSILPALHGAGERMVPLQARLTDTRMYLKVLFPDVTFTDPRPQGGELHAGIIIGNSEIGAGKLFVDPFMYASYCTNGLVFGKQEFSDFGLRKMHVGRRVEDSEQARRVFSDDTLSKDDEAFFAMAHDLILNSANGIQFKAIEEAVLRAAGVEVEGDHVQAVERLVKANGLREHEGKSIMQHLIEGHDLSAWGYVNAVTRTAQDATGYDRQVELERLGGELLAAPVQSWEALTR